MRSNEQYLEELEAYGFSIEMKKPWHWRITKPDYETKLDVWPTKSKFWVVGSHSRAKQYNNLLDLAKTIIVV